MMKVTGTDAWLNQFKADLKKEIEEPALEAMRHGAITLIMALQHYTPVWSGDTVRNFRVGVGGPSSGPMVKASSGPPGPTRTMSLGQEPNRARNERAALQDARSTLNGYKDLSKPLFINNVVVSQTGDSNKFALIDAGLAPDDPGRNKAFGGVRKPGLQLAKAQLKGLFE